MPSPLPGYENTAKLAALFEKAIAGLNSPRLKDCDTACLVIRTLVQKFLLEAQVAPKVRVSKLGKVTIDKTVSSSSTEAFLGFVGTFST